MLSGTCNHEVAFRHLRVSPSSSTCLLYQFPFEYVTLEDIYSCAVDVFLEISKHLFLAYVSILRVRNEFTDLLFNVCSHYQKRGQLW